MQRSFAEGGGLLRANEARELDGGRFSAQALGMRPPPRTPPPTALFGRGGGAPFHSQSGLEAEAFGPQASSPTQKAFRFAASNPQSTIIPRP